MTMRLKSAVSGTGNATGRPALQLGERALDERRGEIPPEQGFEGHQAHARLIRLPGETALPADGLPGGPGRNIQAGRQHPARPQGLSPLKELREVRWAHDGLDHHQGPGLKGAPTVWGGWDQDGWRLVIEQPARGREGSFDAHREMTGAQAPGA